MFSSKTCQTSCHVYKLVIDIFSVLYMTHIIKHNACFVDLTNPLTIALCNFLTLSAFLSLLVCLSDCLQFCHRVLSFVSFYIYSAFMIKLIDIKHWNVAVTYCITVCRWHIFARYMRTACYVKLAPGALRVESSYSSPRYVSYLWALWHDSTLRWSMVSVCWRVSDTSDFQCRFSRISFAVLVCLFA